MRASITLVRLACFMALVCTGAGCALAQLPAAAPERTVKAAFVYKFLGYVEWPPNAVPPPPAPIVIGVMGDDDLAAELAEIVRGRTVDAHPVEVRRLGARDAIAALNVLYIGRADHARLAALARMAASRGILVVSDADDGLDEGAMINLVVVDARVRFEVGLDVAERAGIHLSSRLLAVAQVVRTAPH